MNMKTVLGIVAALVVVVAVGLGPRLAHWFGVPGASTSETTAAVSIGGPFELVNGAGETVTDQDFRGKWMLVYFGYTFCPDVCPTSLGTVGVALDGLDPAIVEKITPVFITVDPERDTPEAVGKYVAHFHPDMVGLTGSPEQVDAAVKAYRAYYKKQPQDDGPYLMDHSSVTYLMNPEGEFVRHFSHGTTPDAMAEGLREAVGAPGA
ncbi:Cytochrome oxidase biogenesis protein [Caenispirillum salinarum AK4]|uniref:Cytochrome oxidase biogenesis protein n=1 Tax=Caenispirillum salinarum AK4 TaxID=1238182 RepID=K9HP06_9PROT|nr:SCO family protein [Caenispirillum salinarum]EKV32038.1 Cytochrome oxidase biogenesis protein [Caenispirillum salinarum AK4]